MTYRDHLADALYQAFTTTILFSPPDQEGLFRSLKRLGYVKPVAHGHAPGYQITPAGHAVARARWGHEQR